MSVVALAAIGLADFVASLVSGVFGIAGGMIMLGVLLVFFDVPTAMVLFSVLAATANAWRVMSWWRHINWRIHRDRADGVHRLRPQQGLGLSDPRIDALYDRVVATQSSPEHRVGWHGIALRPRNDRHSAHCREWRAIARRVLSKELDRPQDHHSHQGDLRHC